MRNIEIYLIITTILIIGHSVYREVRKEGITGELCMLSLGIGLTMEENIIGQMVLVIVITFSKKLFFSF